MARSKIIFWGICLILVVLIVFRYYAAESRIKGQELKIKEYLGQDVFLTGRVIEEPDVRNTNTKLTIEARLSRESQASSQASSQSQVKILVTVNRYPEYKYRDEIKIKGKLQEPAPFEDFDYKEYLKTKEILAVMYFPQIELERRGRASPLLELKDKLRENIYSSMPPPQADILGALILGDKNRITNDFKEKFNRAGISHIVVISGMNIILFVSFLMPLLLFLGLWKRQAIIFCLIFIFVYILFTGLQASSIRAGIMGSLSLIAPLFGRKSESLRLIIIAGLVMITVNPLYLIYDVGFQLSFLATLGIVYLNPILSKYLKFETIVSTFSAYIFTAPILIYSFGRISLVGLLTNILVLPVIIPIMILGLIFSISGIFWLALEQILSWPVWFLLNYVIKVVEVFSGPWSVQNLKPISWLWLLFYYGLLIFICHYFYKKQKSFPYFLRKF